MRLPTSLSSRTTKVIVAAVAGAAVMATAFTTASAAAKPVAPPNHLCKGWATTQVALRDDPNMVGHWGRIRVFADKKKPHNTFCATAEIATASKSDSKVRNIEVTVSVVDPKTKKAVEVTKTDELSADGVTYWGGAAIQTNTQNVLVSFKVNYEDEEGASTRNSAEPVKFVTARQDMVGKFAWWQTGLDGKPIKTPLTTAAKSAAKTIAKNTWVSTNSWKASDFNRDDEHAAYLECLRKRVDFEQQVNNGDLGDVTACKPVVTNGTGRYVLITTPAGKKSTSDND